MRQSWLTAAVAGATIVGLVATAAAQNFHRAGTELFALRPVAVPAGKAYSVLVTEFLHHGQINPAGTNVVAAARNGQLAPVRVLQLGPGDFCRVAIQVLPGQTHYELFYGGEPPTEELPAWTARAGLLLETRRYKNCDLSSLESVREAFASAEPYGADYVDAVQHSHNPMTLRVEPFMSYYRGYLNVAGGGTYGFLTSSRDASFLLIDGKEVVSAPGVHGPMRRAKPGSRENVRLDAGAHLFEYYHVATGADAVMVAAWEVNPPEEKPKPAPIPPEPFRAGAVGHVPAGPPTVNRTPKYIPDFVMKPTGDVPLPDNPQPLVGVALRDSSVKALTMNSRAHWEFGDGQTADQLNVDHVYLRPGLYTVKLAVKQGARVVETVNRVYVDRPFLTRKDEERFHTLDQYLPVLDTYDPRKLDLDSLTQLVLAYLAKADAVRAELDEARLAAESGEEESEAPGSRPATRPRPDATPAGPDPKPYLAKALAAGKVAFLEAGYPADDPDKLLKLARLIAPTARNMLGESPLAYRIWYAAGGKIKIGELRAECAVEAADIAVNDLLDLEAAKRLLDAARRELGGSTLGTSAGKLQWVLGDYSASTGKADEARKAYAQATETLAAAKHFAERIAWQGAHARSTEAFLKEGQLGRAAEQLRGWQQDAPSERLEGYLTLLYARYWAGRELYAQAVAQVEQLECVNPESAYIDQALMLAARCESQRGRRDRALAILHALVKQYPGSPLVPDVKQVIARLEAGREGSEKMETENDS